MFETLCITAPEGWGKPVDKFQANLNGLFIHSFPPACPRIMH
jgi:hypothetical protein